MTRYATIIGTGSYIPETIETNEEFTKKMVAVNPGLAEVPAKFEGSTGILQRRFAPEGWAPSDMAAEAAKAAIADAGLTPEDIDLVLVGTDSPDYLTPATSVVVQHKIGAVNAGTWDIGCACASFPTGLAQAAGMIAVNPNLKYIVVIGTYMMSKLADPTDVTRFYYSDGAGAAVVGVSDKPGFVSSSVKADGQYYKSWGIYAGAAAEPATAENVAEGKTNVRFISPFPASVNEEGWPARVRETAANGNFAVEDIDFVIFTQVRHKTINNVMDNLGLPQEKAHFVADKFGYTGSACLPMCFDDARKLGKIKSGDLVVFVGSGVGYNQAAVAFVMP